MKHVDRVPLRYEGKKGVSDFALWAGRNSVTASIEMGMLKSFRNQQLACGIFNILNEITCYAAEAACGTGETETSGNPEEEKTAVEDIIADATKDIDIPEDQKVALNKELTQKANNYRSIYSDMTDEKLTEKLKLYAKAWVSNTSAKTATEDAKTEVGKIIGGNYTLADHDIEKLAKRYEILTNDKVDADAKNIEILNMARGLAGAAQAEELSTALVKDPEGNKDKKIELTEVSDAMAKESQEDFNNAFLNYGQQQVDSYDENRDGKVSYFEFEKEEKANANRNHEEFKSAVSIATFETLDQNGDNYLDKEEMASLSWAVSKFNDVDPNRTASDITAQEIAGYVSALAHIGAAADMKANVEDYTTEEIQNYWNQNGKDGALSEAKLKGLIKTAYENFKKD